MIWFMFSASMLKNELRISAMPRAMVRTWSVVVMEVVLLKRNPFLTSAITRSNCIGIPAAASSAFLVRAWDNVAASRRVFLAAEKAGQTRCGNEIGVGFLNS